MHARAYVLFVWEFRNDDIAMISKENVSVRARSRRERTNESIELQNSALPINYSTFDRFYHPPTSLPLLDETPSHSTDFDLPRSTMLNGANLPPQWSMPQMNLSSTPVLK